MVIYYRKNKNINMKNNIKNKILHPYFITGFTDAEGCFHVSVVDKADQKVGKSVRVLFQISLHKKDKALLNKIKKYFGVGTVIDRKDNVFYYKVSQAKDLMLIIDHFDKFFLLTQKRADFELFKQAVNLILKKEHLTYNGLQKIINIKASMNFGKLSDKLLASFPNTVPVKRPIIKDPVISDFE